MNVDSFLSFLEMFFLSFIIEMIIAVTMFVPSIKKTRLKGWKLALLILAGLTIIGGGTVGVAAACASLEWNVYVNIAAYLVMFVFIILGFYVVFDYKFNEIVFVSVLGYTIQHIGYQLTRIVLDTGLNVELYSNIPDQANLIYRLISYAIKIVVLVGAYFLLAKRFKKYKKYALSSAHIYIISVIAVLLILVANAFIVRNTYWFNYWIIGICAAVLIISTVLVDFIAIWSLSLIANKEKNDILKSTYEAKIKQHEMEVENINFINMKCHDLRKQIRFLKTKKDSITDEDLEQLEEALRIYDTGVRTGFSNLDILIQDKGVYCKSKGIDFTTLIDGKMFEKFDSNDIYYLFLNLIDNAIEAVEQIEDKSKKSISLTAYKKQGIVVIEERNYFIGKLDFNSDHSIKTTKKDGSIHGLGTKSIVYIVNKYNGKITHTVNGEILDIKIAL